MDVVVGLAALAGTLALVVGPGFVLWRCHGARLRWFAYGVAAWGVALLLKIALHGLGVSAPSSAPAWARGTGDGVVSSLAELGVAAALLHSRLSIRDVLAFGVGAGAFEIVCKTLVGVAFADPSGSSAAATSYAALALLGLCEHAANLIGHTSTRVLVYLARAHRRLPPAAIAVTTFALVDGVAAYGSAAGWRWHEIRVYAPLVGFLAAMACLEAVLAASYWRRLAGSAPPGERGR